MSKQFASDTPTIEEIRALRKPRRQEVDIPLDPNALVELERLQRDLARAEIRAGDALNDPDVTALRDQLAAVEADIGEAFATFVFQQLPRAAYRELVEEHTVEETVDEAATNGDADAPTTPRTEKRLDDDAFAPALIAASCVQPRLTPETVIEMFADPEGGWGANEWDLLYNAALVVNLAKSSVPSGARSIDRAARSEPSSTTAARRGSRTRSS